MRSDMSDDAGAPRVSGTIILDQMILLRELHGPDVMGKAMAALPRELRDELETVLRGEWCSVKAALELKRAIADILHEDLLALQRRIVRLATERTLTTVWRFFMRHLTDDQLARRTPILYSRTFDRGELTMVARRANGVDLELTGWSDIPQFDLVGLMTGIETVFMLANRKDPHVEATRRPTSVLLAASWKK
jgi:hypothetical protein